jgi:23S rRNA pseudouridine2605 synthase
MRRIAAVPYRLAREGPSRKATPLLSNAGNTTTTTIPTGAQLNESRLKQWHQQGEALLTLENLRSWINAAGLVLFAPRPQIGSPAGTLVEAVIGAPAASPTLAQTAEAKSLLARMIAEGMAVPLNLLGATAGAESDTPDFVCSTAVFSYIFTLRGDKTWKKAPETAGAVKVSPLALATYEALGRRGPLPVSDLTTELGKEVTEAAVLRALGELWTHLRVLPLAQAAGGATVWELAGTRFGKQIKAGANAGQPSALSALITLYLGQAVVASEEEIESFLSPLAARSRIRDVVHALMAARQLETLAVEGRTVLHVTGDLPAFLSPEVPVAADAASAEPEAGSTDAADGGPRISKFVAKPKKIGTGYLAKASPSKFASNFSAGASAAARPGARFGSKSPFPGKPAGDRERRPFGKAAGAGKAGSVKAGFDKPWDEEKAKRLAAVARPSEVAEPIADAAEVAPPERAPRVYKPRADGDTRRSAFGAKSAFGRKPAFGSKPSFGTGGAGAPRRFDSGDSRPPRRDFVPRPDSSAGPEKPPRKTFSKPGTFGRKREGFGAGRDGAGDARPPRRDFGGGADRSARSATPRTPGSYAPRAGGSDRPNAGRPAGKAGGGFASRTPYSPRGGGEGKPEFTRGASAGRPERGSSTEGGKRVYRKFDAPRDRPARPLNSDRPARPFSSDRSARPAGAGSRGGGTGHAGKSGGARPGGFKSPRPSGKPGGGFGKKPFSKPGAGKPSGTFAKFADGAKPFGKRSPARKYKPREGDSA